MVEIGIELDEVDEVMIDGGGDESVRRMLTQSVKDGRGQYEVADLH